MAGHRETNKDRATVWRLYIAGRSKTRLCFFICTRKLNIMSVNKLSVVIAQHATVNENRAQLHNLYVGSVVHLIPSYQNKIRHAGGMWARHLSVNFSSTPLYRIRNPSVPVMWCQKVIEKVYNDRDWKTLYLCLNYLDIQPFP